MDDLAFDNRDLDDARLARVMRRAALAAAAETMKYFRTGDLGVEAKSDESPVCKADLAAHKAIRDQLAQAYPEIPQISEEGDLSPPPAGRPYFMIDPLDGTKEFVREGGEFTVNVALIEGDAPVLGVVSAPAVGRLFWTPERGRAVEETGVFGLDALGALTDLAVASPSDAAVRIVATKSHMNPETQAFLDRYPDATCVHAASALKFCLVAAGEADLYPRMSRTMEWDTAAGQAVLEAAGGVLETLDGGRLAYGKPDWVNPHFLAKSRPEV